METSLSNEERASALIWTFIEESSGGTHIEDKVYLIKRIADALNEAEKRGRNQISVSPCVLSKMSGWKVSYYFRVETVPPYSPQKYVQYLTIDDEGTASSRNSWKRAR